MSRRYSPFVTRSGAFEAFVEDRMMALFGTAYLLVGDVHHAEDLLQSALEKAYRRWRRIGTMQHPEAYVRKVIVNLANDRWRRRSSAGLGVEAQIRRHGEEMPADRARRARPGEEADADDGFVLLAELVAELLDVEQPLVHLEDRPQAAVLRRPPLPPGQVVRPGLHDLRMGFGPVDHADGLELGLESVRLRLHLLDDGVQLRLAGGPG
jgi:DNA-directed RNA polymerase specialized sigma24 family protein